MTGSKEPQELNTMKLIKIKSFFIALKLILKKLLVVYTKIFLNIS